MQALSDGSAALVMPWSREPLGFVDEVQPGETSRPRSEKVLACAKREGFSRLEMFSTRITGHEVYVCLRARHTSYATDKRGRRIILPLR